MDPIVELKQERYALIEEAEAIYQSAAGKKRRLSSKEQEKFDDLMARADELEKEIRNKEDLERRKFAFTASHHGPIKPVPNDSYSSYTPTEGELRMFRPDESLASFIPVDLPDGIQADELSIGRWFRGVVTGNWKGAEAERRAMATTDDTLGGYMIPDPLSLRVIDLARARSVLINAGALTIPMETKTLTMARVTGDPTAYWKGENEEGTESTGSMGAVKFVAKTLMALVRISIELVEDSPNVSEVVENALAQTLALKLDYAGLFGSGSEEEPLGIYNDPDISVVDMGTDGSALADYGPFVQAIQKVEEANGVASVAVYAPRTKAEVALLADTTGQPLQAPRSVAELRHFTSTQIPTDLEKGTAENASVAFVGNLSQVMVGIRKQISIEVSREESEAFKKLQVLVRAYLRGDVNTAHPDQICKIDGIIPAS